MSRPWLLIVEDDDDIREVEAAILEAAGFRVAGAADGQLALEALERHDGPAPALILLDIMLPRMNGLELMHELRRMPAYAEVPVVVVSGDGNARAAAEAVGAKAVLVKPPDLDALLGTVRAVVFGGVTPDGVGLEG